MAKWHFWGEKEFSDVYENIYIRSYVEDWFSVVFEVVSDIFKQTPPFFKIRILGGYYCLT